MGLNVGINSIPTVRRPNNFKGFLAGSDPVGDAIFQDRGSTPHEALHDSIDLLEAADTKEPSRGQPTRGR